MTETNRRLMSIGAVAKAVGVAATALRYYEREGVLRSTVRSPSGYRLYDERALEQLEFIRAAQAVGFTLRDVRLLLEFDGRQRTPKAGVQELIRSRLGEVEQKMRDLRRVRTALGAALTGCERSGSGECPVLEELHDATKRLTKREATDGKKRRSKKK
jgi:MerR family mercuric resistance operon transcriptional regulator